MKKVFALVLMLSIVGITSAELFVNAGFEDGLEGWNDWGSGSGGVGWRSGNTVNVVTDGTAHSGENHVYTVWPSSEGTAWGYTMVYQQPMVEAGESYTFSAWVRDADSQPGGEGSITVKMSFEQRYWDGVTDWRGYETEDRVHLDFDVASDGEWHQVSADHLIPSTVNQLTSIIWIEGIDNPMDVDDYSLALVPEPASLALLGLGGLLLRRRRK